MIKKENIKQLLSILNFTELDNGTFYKGYNEIDNIIVDIKSEEITWPCNLIVNDKVPTNIDKMF